MIGETACCNRVDKMIGKMENKFNKHLENMTWN